MDLTTNPLGFPKRISNFRFNPKDISHYNEPSELVELTEAIAKHSGIKEEEVMLTAGGDQAIEIVLTHVLERGDIIGILMPTFPRFEIVARRLCNAEVIPFRNLKDISRDCKVIFICTPNNPTTKELEFNELAGAIRENKETFFIIDSIFADFGKNKVSKLINRFDNLAVLKSLSKPFGIPGLRIGWIESRKENIELFRRGISPFRVPHICQRMALEVLKDKNHVKKTIKFLKKEFKKIKKELRNRVVRESNVPFFLFLIDKPVDAREFLLKKSIRVVDSSSFNNSESGFLRIMISNSKENKILVKALKEFLDLK